MHKPAHLFIAPTGIHWLCIAIIALLLVPLTIFSLEPDRIYNAYFRTFATPAVEREFGFRMERTRMYFHTQALEVFVIKSLEPEGVLAKAGVRVGDVPLGTYMPKNDVAFCRDLLRSHAQITQIHLVNGDEYEARLGRGESSITNVGYNAIIPKQNYLHPRQACATAIFNPCFRVKAIP